MRFWNDNWLGKISLSEQYHVLYNIVHRKYDTIANVMSTGPLKVLFWWALVGNKFDACHDLVCKNFTINLSDQPDHCKWLPTKNGVFTVQSIYEHLMDRMCMILNFMVVQDSSKKLKLKIFYYIEMSYLPWIVYLEDDGNVANNVAFVLGWDNSIFVL